MFFNIVPTCVCSNIGITVFCMYVCTVGLHRLFILPPFSRITGTSSAIKEDNSPPIGTPWVCWAVYPTAFTLLSSEIHHKENSNRDFQQKICALCSFEGATEGESEN